MQADLFPKPPMWPEGFRYEEGFVPADEQEALVAFLAALPLGEAQYKQWTARRRVLSYAGRYDFERQELLPAPPIPEALLSVRSRAAHWAGVPADRLHHALVSEYSPGTALGWHRDVPQFGLVVGISVLGAARMRLRPYPHTGGRHGVRIDLAAGSIYSLQGEARWRWQHAISPTKSLRYSITFRTMTADRCSLSAP
jgi:alkylated DNA repair dioxygenase AlkB